MKEIRFKEYINFSEFSQDAFNLVEYVKNNTNDMTDSEKISYARKTFNKTILNSFIIIGHLDENIINVLQCTNCELKFSIDNMIKNILSHPEVTDEDYTKIPVIIKSPTKYYQSKSGYDIILFKADEKYYKLVIKTTKNHKENFVKSLHLLNKERYLKY